MSHKGTVIAAAAGPGSDEGAAEVSPTLEAEAQPEALQSWSEDSPPQDSADWGSDAVDTRPVPPRQRLIGNLLLAAAVGTAALGSILVVKATNGEM